MSNWLQSVTVFVQLYRVVQSDEEHCCLQGFAAVKADKGPDNSQIIQIVSNVQPDEYEFQTTKRTDGTTQLMR